MDPHHPHRPDPYQHWLDDAANMGLMLFRMRNDSKRERIVTRLPTPVGSRHGSPSGPPMSPQQPPQPPPPPSRHRSHRQAPVATAPPPDATPRTSRALQTPTVATQSSRDSASTRPPSFYLPLD